MCPSSPFPCLCAQCLCLSTYLLIWAPASHTQTCLKPLEGGSKCVVNAFQRLVKCLQPSVYRNNVLLPLQAPLVWNTSLVIWNSHPLCHRYLCWSFSLTSCNLYVCHDSSYTTNTWHRLFIADSGCEIMLSSGWSVSNPSLGKKIRKERVCGCVCLWSSFVLLASVILSSGLFEEVESFLLVLASPGWVGSWGLGFGINFKMRFCAGRG